MTNYSQRKTKMRKQELTPLQEKVVYVSDYLFNRLDNVRNDKEYEETKKAIQCFQEISFELDKLEKIKKIITNL